MDNENNQLEATKAGMSKMIIGAAAAILVIVAVGVVFYIKSNSSSQTQNSASQMEEMSESPAEASSENVQEGEEAAIVNIEGGSYYFKPNVIKAKKGVPVIVVLTAADAMHNFVIDEFNAKTEIVKAGEKTEVEFTPDKVGSFEFYCSVGNHRALGMVGTIEVTE